MEDIVFRDIKVEDLWGGIKVEDIVLGYIKVEDLWGYQGGGSLGDIKVEDL